MCKEEYSQQYGLKFSNDFEVIKEKISRNEMLGIECNYITKKGNKIPVSITITPIKNKNKEIVSFMGLAIDITDRKEAERNLLEALTKERKLGELKSRFVSMASHEFRTPLSTILSSAYLIEKYHDSSDQQKREKHLSRIVSSVNNLTNILNEFLSVGKIDEGKIGLHVTQFELNALINEIISETKGILKSSQSISYIHEGEQLVYLDINLIKNIMLNLISNAIKFSNEDAVIKINTSIMNDEITIMVKDNGIGISTDDQEHLMDRFFRGGNVSNIQGTGLGLYIVSKYVENMKGKIKYTSQLNEGTTFTIYFNNLKINEHEDIITH
jgi:signal transduction histidine kinase